MTAIAFWATLVCLMNNIGVFGRARETRLDDGTMMPCYASPVECTVVVKVNNTALAAGAMVRLPSRAAFVWSPDKAPHAISAVIHVVSNIYHFLLPSSQQF